MGNCYSCDFCSNTEGKKKKKKRKKRKKTIVFADAPGDAPKMDYLTVPKVDWKHKQPFFTAGTNAIFPDDSISTLPHGSPAPLRSTLKEGKGKNVELQGVHLPDHAPGGPLVVPKMDLLQKYKQSFITVATVHRDPDDSTPPLLHPSSPAPLQSNMKKGDRNSVELQDNQFSDLMESSAPLPSASACAVPISGGDITTSVSSGITAHSLTPIGNREQEFNDPPLAEIQGSPLETKIQKPREQLSMLQYIENNRSRCEGERPVPEQTDKRRIAVKSFFIQKPSREKPSEAEVKSENIRRKRNLEGVPIDKVVKVVALKSVLSKNLERVLSEKLLERKISPESEDHNLPNVVEDVVDEREEEKSPKDINNLRDSMMQNLQSQLLRRYSEEQIIPEMRITGNDQETSFSSSDDLVQRNKDLLKTSPVIIKVKPVRQSGPSSRTESMEDGEEGPSGIRKTNLSESKIDVRKSLPHSRSQEQINEEGAIFKSTLSKSSSEISTVFKPSSPEIDSNYDGLIEEVLKEELSYLKSCLCKSPQDQFKDPYKYQFPETGVIRRESKFCQQSYSDMDGEQKMALEKALLKEGEVSSQQSIPEVLVLHGNIKDIVEETLSENNIENLHSSLTEKAQDSLLRRLSNVGSILEEEVEKIVENLSLTDTESQGNESDFSSEEEEIPTELERELSSFSEEDLEKLRTAVVGVIQVYEVCSKFSLDKYNMKDAYGVEILIFPEIYGDLPIQSGSETGINEVVEIKDAFPTGVSAYERGKHQSKEKVSSADEKHRGDNTDFPEHTLSEVQTTDKNTHNNYGKRLQKMKHLSKSHGLQISPEKPTPVTPTFSKEVKSVIQRMGMRSQQDRSPHNSRREKVNREVVKPSSPISKSPLPVKKQTFLRLRANPHEETKSKPSKAQKKANKKKETLKGHKLPSPEPIVTKSRKKSKVTTPCLRKETRDVTGSFWWYFWKPMTHREGTPLVPTPVLSTQFKVVDIAKLMKVYISMIVKKRYSTSRSVSSHGSQGSSR